MEGYRGCKGICAGFHSVPEKKIHFCAIEGTIHSSLSLYPCCLLMPGGQSCCTNWHFKLKEQKWQLCVCWFSQSSVVTFSQCFLVGLTRQWMEIAQWVWLLPYCTVSLVVALLHSEFGCCLIAQWVWLLPYCTVSLVAALLHSEFGCCLTAQWVWLLPYCTVSLVAALLHSEFGCCLIVQWVWLLPYRTVSLAVALLHSEFGCCLIAQRVWLLPYCKMSLVVALLQSVTVTGRRQRVCTMPQWTRWVSASTWRESTRGAACVWTAR